MEDIYSTGRIVNDPMIVKSIQPDGNPGEVFYKPFRDIIDGLNLVLKFQHT